MLSSRGAGQRGMYIGWERGDGSLVFSNSAPRHNGSPVMKLLLLLLLPAQPRLGPLDATLAVRPLDPRTPPSLGASGDSPMASPWPGYPQPIGARLSPRRALRAADSPRSDHRTCAPCSAEQHPAVPCRLRVSMVPVVDKTGGEMGASFAGAVRGGIPRPMALHRRSSQARSSKRNRARV